MKQVADLITYCCMNKLSFHTNVFLLALALGSRQTTAKATAWPLDPPLPRPTPLRVQQSNAMHHAREGVPAGMEMRCIPDQSSLVLRGGKEDESESGMRR